MVRRKVKLAFIMNETKRKATYRKRLKGLMKKMEEITTLCGIEACAIVFGLNDDEPVLWPPSREAVQYVLSRFKNLSNIQRFRNMVNLEDFIEKRIKKLEDQVNKLKKDNREKEISQFINLCLSGDEEVTKFGIVDLCAIHGMIERNIMEFNQKLSLLTEDMPQLPPINMTIEACTSADNQGPAMAPEMTSYGLDNQGSVAAPEMASYGANNQGSMVAPEITITEIDKQGSLVAFEMTNYEVDHQDSAMTPKVTINGVDNQESMVVPDITIMEIDNQGCLIPLEMAVNRERQHLAGYIDILRVNQQPDLDKYDWDNNGGPGPIYSSP